MTTLYFFIGTKAQAIKCLPLIKSAVFSGYKVVIVDSGQHAELVNSILSEFNSGVVRLNLFESFKNISTFIDVFKWIFVFTFKHLLIKTKNLSGICIVHGDTLSTLLGLLWAKRNGLKVLHLESGLSSGSLTNPFPEELIRRIVSKFSNILICFDSSSKNYLLKKFGHKNKIIKQVSENTLIETLSDKNLNISKGNVTVTLHRTENLVNKKKLISFVKFLNSLPNNFKINWYLHEPTKNYLKKHNITNFKNINLFDLLPHNNFVDELKRSELVITDGGSIQEECYFLGKKTLIWRKTTEREYALNKNMLISNFDHKKSLDFVLRRYENLSQKNNSIKPSQEILNLLNENFN